jgi:hypothetical protein
MELNHPHQPLQVQADTEKIAIYWEGVPVLTSGPFPYPLNPCLDRDKLRLDLPLSTLKISPVGEGFDLVFSPRGEISFKMDDSWFGHGELIHQRLPLNRLMLPMSPMETIDNGPTGQSCKLTPAWFSSRGVLIIAHTPLSVGINQPPPDYPRYSWDFGPEQGPFRDRPFEDRGGIGDGRLTLRGKDLHLSIVCCGDAAAACRRLIAKSGFPRELPPEELFIHPTWTTWAQYKTDISQEVVLRFADQIILNDYPHGVLEIDARWQIHIGEAAFDPVLFPDPEGMISELHRKGFKVTAWVTPFFDPQSAAYRTARKQNFLVKDHSGEPYPVQWWGGCGGLLDVTNPDALVWFQENLNKLQRETGLDGYKFDGGEACFFPKDGISYSPISSNEYTHSYIEFVAQNFSLTEVRSAWRNQSAPIFFRQWDKASTWAADNGLHSVLTGILALGLTGYPFILPDMVGGNAYEGRPDAELMIRWTQLNSLLPSMQFSLLPWEFSDECNRLCRRYACLHEEFAGEIINLARVTIQTGEPIIRPVWWNNPGEEQALSCDDQYLIGDKFLVAPVLEPGARSRNIYLPGGCWKDYWSSKVFVGSQTLMKYPAPLDILPLFEKIVN